MYRTASSLLVVLVVAGCATPLVAAPPESQGVLPTGEDGRPLNLDFEKGTLEDWTAEGEAFAGQPIKGEIDQNRKFGRGKRANPQGDFWIGGYELKEDVPLGKLTSAPFKVTHPWATFLIGGGSHPQTRVELVDAETGKAILQASGKNEENLRPAIVDLRKHKDKQVFVRIVDEHSAGWGHVNFDNFRFHESRPKLPPGTAPATTPLSPEEAFAAMTLPEGFRVTVCAAEPEVQQPIAMALDHRGRLWIAEAYAYPLRRKDDEARDRILIFEDTDGDGKFDSRKVFYEGLNLVSGMEVGFGGVFVGAAPYLLFIPDRDGDDQPDGEPEDLLDGWGYQDTHETLNAFIWGPDGWLYGCHGVFTQANVGKPGAPEDERERLNCAIWRYHPVREEFEVFAHGGSNQWGVDFDDFGQAFMTTCRSRNGGGPVSHVAQGGYYWRQAGGHIYPHAYGVLKASADEGHGPGGAGGDREKYGGHAHCGAMIYLGDNWPEQYRGRLVYGNIHGHRLNQSVIARRGSGFRVDHIDNLMYANDSRHMGVNLRYGPDGGVYLIDWYDMQSCHTTNPKLVHRNNGRTYKIAYGDVAHEQIDIAQLSDAELVKLQLHPNDWHVRHARRELQQRAAAGKLANSTHAALADVLQQSSDVTRRLRALWALHVTGGLTEELTMRLLDDEGELVRAWAIQLELEDKQPSATVVKRLEAMARDDDSHLVRLYLAGALQRLPLDDRWNIATALVSHAEDADDRNLPLMYWYGIEPLVARDKTKAARLAAASRIPLVRQYIARRIATAK